MNGPNRREYLKAGIATTVGLGVMGARPAEADDAASPAGEKVSPERLVELAAELARSTGRLILPGDDGYEAASAPANGRFNSIRPFAVAQCRSEADVVASVKWSVKHGVSPVVRGGGHSYAGFSTTQELLIDVEALNQVTIDRKNGCRRRRGVPRTTGACSNIRSTARSSSQGGRVSASASAALCSGGALATTPAGPA